MNRVVISGPTGAVGMALIQKCIEERVEVLALCRKDSVRSSRIPVSEYVTKEDCSLDELQSFQSGKKYDVFYHFAWDGTTGDARNDTRLQNKNVHYALDAAELAHRLGCHTFIGAGSQAEYGRVEGTLSPSTPAFPENGYGIAKLCAGQLTRLLCRQLGMEHIWARILSVYGPYDGKSSMIMSAIGKLLNGEVPRFTKGEQMWDYLYSADAANALFLLGRQGVGGKVYCLGSGKAIPLSEYIQIIRDSIDHSLKLGLGELPYNDNQVMYLCADITDLAADTGFSPETNFEEGISQTIQYCLNERNQR